ncbi:phage tail spike protein [Lactococcus lactis]|uniref:phage tail spike protein n=1 Tax=Lactococcus lactis TaxID=1358 RepID=UPI0020A73FCD|nr:phage tail spike protein [Lactococcus lactis]
MLISIHDHTLKRVGFLSNDDSETPDFKDDNFHRYLAQGTSTFDFTVNKIKNGVVQDYVQLLNERAYFSFQYEGEDFLFDSVIVEEDDDKITFNCLTLNLEMRNEEVKALKNTASHNIQWYFDQLGLINFAKISLGINQVENDTRVINYDSEDTKLARLISVIQNFDAEFEFVTKLKRDGTLDNITLNIYKKNDGGDVQGVGQNRNDVLLSFGENVTGVNRKVEKSQIFNSLYVTGKDGLSWKDSAWSVTNSEGQEEFYKRAGESYAKAPLSAQMFPSQLQSSTGDIFTNKNESTEYATVNAMWGYALSQLKQYAYPLVTYEVTATSNLTVSSTGDGMPLHIGDTVRIQDKNFIDSDGNVGLFLSARVSELEISFTNPTNNKITFSNYIKLKSEVSDDLTARMQEIINANTPYRPDITSTNGLQFKNGTGTTTLGAHIYFGSDDKETIADSYEWSKDGAVVAPTQTITVDASGVADKAVYSFKATIAGKAVANQSVTITNVNDGKGGADGKTSYTHVAWANNITGTDGFTTVYPNLNLLDGTSSDLKTVSANGWGTQGSLTTNTIDFKIGQSYTYSVWIQDCDIDTRAVIYLFDSAGYTPCLGNTITTGSSGFSTVTFNISVEITRYEVSIGFMESQASYHNLSYSRLKLEPGSTATPYMPSASEATTADWPSYIGQYSDFIATASTDPAKYAPWTVFKGNDGKDGLAGKDGNGIKTTDITYAISTSGTTPPTTGWTSSVPSLVNGQYLWTKTVWTYTDNSSKTGYSVTYISKDGSNGDPGKVVSDTEPTTKFKGLTWKYSGSADMTASDGTVILSGTEYYWSGTNWILSEINAHNINGDNLNVTNGKFTDGVIETSWTNGTVSGSTNIQNDHLIITRTDSSANTTNSIGLDSTQGLIMVYTENSTGRTISVGTNFQGMSLTDSTGTSASISPAGVKLSSDVAWTKIGNIGGRRAEWKRENNRVTMNIHGGNGDGFPVVTSGGTLLGILPTNARPPSDISMPATAQAAGATAQISINSSGEVRCYRWGGDSIYFSAYISYYVE